MINRHAGPALMMCSTLMGAAVLMGVLVYGFKRKAVPLRSQKPGVEMMKDLRCIQHGQHHFQ